MRLSNLRLPDQFIFFKSQRKDFVMLLGQLARSAGFSGVHNL